jgi:quercetin dioxygenase-like cupin family protein
MSAPPLDVILKRFDTPDEVRVFPKGRFEVVRIGGLTIGRATYEPGWHWSEHVGPTAGAALCSVEHVGLVLSGTATVELDGGPTVQLRAGDVFHVPAAPHDSRVVGDAVYVSLHFLGAGAYAKTPTDA